MGKKRKYQTQTAIFNLSSIESKDLFVELAVKILDNRYIYMETKSHKIIFHLQGGQREIYSIRTELNKLSNYLQDAIEGKHGEFIYRRELTDKIFRPQLTFSMFNKGLLLLGFDSNIKNEKLYTNATYIDMKRLHAKLIRGYHEMPPEQNRDIIQMLILLYLISDKSFEELKQIGLGNLLLREVNNRLQFTQDKEKVFTKFISILNKSQTLEMEENFEDFDITSVFDGGKIVFIENKEDQYSSPFDGVENIENKEDS